MDTGYVFWKQEYEAVHTQRTTVPAAPRQARAGLPPEGVASALTRLAGYFGYLLEARASVSTVGAHTTL